MALKNSYSKKIFKKMFIAYENVVKKNQHPRCKRETPQNIVLEWSSV